MGIDEAGRGPVLGPMVYGCLFCPISYKKTLSTLEFADSKTLKEEKREELFESLKADETICWAIDVIDPRVLSAKMLRKNKINLNEISHESAMGLVKRVMDMGYLLTEVYVDTVGDADKYRIKLTERFPSIKFVVAKKVDSLYPVVSEPSIVAKKIAGEIKSFSADGWIAPKLSKRVDKFMLYLLTAGKKALEDGGVTEEVMKELDITKCGVIIGSALGGMKIFQDAIEALRVSYKKMNPFCVPFATTNMGSAILAMDLGWMGPNYSISTACATSNYCILNAANHIIRGETDMMLSGGSDSAIIPIGLGGFVACNSLSQRNDDPTKASRPWDVSRDGFVMGEGAGVLLLEELEHAKARGAKIYAEFMGGSFTCDAYHMTEPHPDGTGIALCIEKALAQSGVAREDVNYINAHATSTQSGDLNEYEAIIRCFGDNSELKINSTKSMVGHLLGAAGAVEAVATVKAIQTGWLHPNINLENPDIGVDKNVLVGAKKERFDIKVALSNSFGFGGHNSTILFAPYKDQ